MTLTTRPGAQQSAQEELTAQLQATRFRLMTELGCGKTPMRAVIEAFDHAVETLSNTHSGSTLVTLAERTVRAEFAPTTSLVDVA